jgi:oxygen-independent coproporphyrinogen-3 oxidase
MFSFSSPPPLSLYVHVPWCVRKCPYCDFNSHEGHDSINESAYMDALIRDLELELPDVEGRRIETIFIGGGTPSLFSAAAYAQFFAALRERVTVAADAEITLEANPGTFEAARFADYRQVGINRLSIGIQSFDEQALSALGRIHDRQQAIRAVEIAHQVGFANFNLDLMFGLPGQTAATAVADVQQAIALSPAHISYYQLTLEPNTYFYHHPPELPEDDPIIDWQLASQQELAEAGYEQYEVSAYVKQDHQCQHNLNYWQFGDYIGIGAGAHGKVTSVEQQSITRRIKQKHPQQYLASAGTTAGIVQQESLATEDIAFEFMLNALRLKHGVASELFPARCGVELSQFQAAVDHAQQEGLLENRKDRIQPTEKGYRFLNYLIELFLP